jgi:hypothetical protein
MSQQSVRQPASRSALDAQAVLRKVRADRERRLEDLAVEVLIALGERDEAVQDAELRAGEALRVMTVDEGLSVREAADWCGGGVTVRDVTRLATCSGLAGRHRPISAGHGWLLAVGRLEHGRRGGREAAAETAKQLPPW